MEISVEMKRNLADHTDNVTTVCRDEMDMIPMFIFHDQVLGDLKHFTNTAILYRRNKRQNPTSIHRL